MPELIFMKPGTYIMAPKPIFNGVLHTTLPSVRTAICVSHIFAKQWHGKNLQNVARQRLSKKVTAARNTQARIEELLNESFSMSSMSFQGKQAISSSQNFFFPMLHS
jgi:hypothetical protein